MTEGPRPTIDSARPKKSWDEFWRFYVCEHRDAGTRRLHFAGTLGAIVCLAAAALWQSLWLIFAAPVVAYGFAWVAHFAVERNTPATFRFPLRSLMADVRMFGLMCAGRMDDEVKRIVNSRDS